MRRSIAAICGIVSLVLVVLVVFMGVRTYLAHAERGHDQVVACNQTKAVHQVTILDGQLTVPTTTGELCDTLTITNQDNRLRLMAFGVHDHHQAYDGVTEKILAKGESMTVILDRAGRFTFHDHLDDSVHGTFIVR